jgi:hypothetical protein
MPYMQGTLWDDRSEWNAASDDGNTSEDDDDPHARLPICGITSVSFAMQDDQSVNMYWMRKLRSIIGEAPSLRFLELRYWSATELSGTDESLGEPGRWNATHLSLLECGPITLEVEYVLGMPKDLQSLEIISELTPNVKRSDLDFPISIQEAVSALEPVQTSLVELKFDPGASEHWICPESHPAAWQTLMEVYQSHAFKSLSKLQRLKAPLEMLSQSTGKMRRNENHTFYTNFPPSLEELTLVVTSREPFHQALEGTYALPGDQVVLEDLVADISNLSCQLDDYEKAHELFEELSQLADHRHLVPALRELHLIRDPCQWLECEHVQQYTRQLEQAGIAVYIHAREIEGPTQRNYKRRVSEV